MKVADHITETGRCITCKYCAFTIVKSRKAKQPMKRMREHVMENHYMLTAVKPSFAYTAIVTEKGFSIGRADKGTKGYTPMPQFGTFKSYDDAASFAEARNTELGHTKEQAAKIVLGTMEFRSL